MDVELHPLVREDCFSQKTVVSRMLCETRLWGIRLKYNISDEDTKLLMEGITGYVTDAMIDARKWGR